MSNLVGLRVLVNERLTAAAEEIFALFERTIAEYEEKLCRSEQENQRKQRLLDVVVKSRVSLPRAEAGVQVPAPSPPDPALHQKIIQTAMIKEEPEEQTVKLEEEEHLPGFVPESITVCVKAEESSLLQQIQTEHREETQEEDRGASETEGDTGHSLDTDNNEDWRRPINPADPPMETEADGDYDNQIQITNRITAAQQSSQSAEYKSGPETSAAVNTGNTSGGEEANKKRHQCLICRKRFESNHRLQSHIRVHTGEKPYSCPICQKTFNETCNLRRHMRTHTGEKPYRCSICKKTFSHTCNLKTHMRTHTGEQPYRCSLCSKSFNDHSNFRKHLNLHTKTSESLVEGD